MLACPAICWPSLPQKQWPDSAVVSLNRTRMWTIAPACVGTGEGSDHFVSHVCSNSLHFCKRLFPRLEPMTSWSQGNNFTAAPRLPFYKGMQHKYFPGGHGFPNTAKFYLCATALDVLLLLTWESTDKDSCSLFRQVTMPKIYIAKYSPWYNITRVKQVPMP
jgi:hypothetical protein